MKLKNIKIGTQLRLGLGGVMVLVVFLGVLAWKHGGLMWQQTEGLYDHPLMVQRAIGAIEADILMMHREMKDICLAENDPERQTLIQMIDTSEADAYRQCEIAYGSYLGPRSDVDDVQRGLVQWKSIRDETLRLLRAGKTAEAVSRTRAGGPGGAHVQQLLRHVQDLRDFAAGRADLFYGDATRLHDSLDWQLGMVVGLILLMCVGVGLLLLRGIRRPLRELITVTDQYRQGKMDARCGYESANEFGALSAAFNQMVATLQTEMHIKENVAKLAGVLLQEEELRAFCPAMLQTLLEQTGSQVGAVYLLNPQKTAFELHESIGLSADSHKAFSATNREGEFGAALATLKIQRITEIPADSHFTFHTVSGDFKPREIITIPVPCDGGVTAVISLASVRSYPEPTLRLVDEVWSVLTARINGVLGVRQLRDFSRRLEQQNHELEAQQKELALQADELRHQNAELEMQKRQLDEASRLKSTFLSNMSHELRTPLNSVIALSGVLNRRLAKTIPADEYSYLEIIERNGKHLLSLINDVLDISRIEAGREELSLACFTVRTLVGEVVAMLEPLAQEKQLALLNEVGNDLPPVTSDFGKCRHILQNLVANAVKFTEAGSVRISAQQVDDAICIAISDTGIGIAAEHLSHIFEEFRQADESTSRKYGGTGLGLSIAKKYAGLLQGSITVASTPGTGSTFTFRLPLRSALPAMGGKIPDYTGVATTGGPGVAVAGHGRTILLVEDTEPVVIQVTDILSCEGYTVRVARNGAEAIAQIEQALPDAVILDLMMPGVDGFQVLKAIRGTERTGQLPVIILTAKHVTPEELSFLKGNHIHQLIQKGDVGRGELLAAVAKMVAPRVEPPAPAPEPRRTARVRRSGKPVVLVVEDNPDNMATAKALLQDTCIVIEATDGKVGVEQARRHVPDLILMDLALPVMDGFAALAAIREDESLRDIPVVVVTASAMKGNREEILACGFDGYISKPIDEALLRTVLEEKLHGG